MTLRSSLSTTLFSSELFLRGFFDVPLKTCFRWNGFHDKRSRIEKVSDGIEFPSSCFFEESDVDIVAWYGLYIFYRHLVFSFHPYRCVPYCVSEARVKFCCGCPLFRTSLFQSPWESGYHHGCEFPSQQSVFCSQSKGTKYNLTIHTRRNDLNIE